MKKTRKLKKQVARARSTSMILGAVLAVLLAVLLLLYVGTRLRATITSEEILPAAEYPELFEQALTAAESTDTFAALASTDIEDYSIVHITLNIRSFGLISCEWITAGITPLEGDIVLFLQEIPDVGALSGTQGDIYILSLADKAGTGRNVWLDYYVYGLETYTDAIR